MTNWENRSISPKHIKESDITPSGSWNNVGHMRILDGTLNIPVSVKIGDKYFHHPIGATVTIGKKIRSGGTVERMAVITSKPEEGAMKGGRRKSTMKKRSRKSRKWSRRA